MKQLTRDQRRKEQRKGRRIRTQRTVEQAQGPSLCSVARFRLPIRGQPGSAQASSVSVPPSLCSRVRESVCPCLSVPCFAVRQVAWELRSTLSDSHTILRDSKGMLGLPGSQQAALAIGTLSLHSGPSKLLRCCYPALAAAAGAADTACLQVARTCIPLAVQANWRVCCRGGRSVNE